MTTVLGLRSRSVLAILAAVLSLAGLLAITGGPAAGFGSSTAPVLPSISAGGYMTCGVQPDFTATCWGDNVSEGPGQATPPAGVRFLEVNAGYNTGCGITFTRTVVCWGNNGFGKVTSAPAGTFLHVAPGFNFVCALRTDGTPVCWGADDAGQVTNTPTTEVFTQLTVGIRHACGLRSNGTILCWGANADGQLNVPEGTYSAVNSGNFTVCAIRSADSTVVCWGRNNGGQLTEPEGAFVQISVGFAHVCGLRPDRTITCWGRNLEGQSSPPAGQYTHVSAGTFHSCAMPVSGPPAVCWGNNAAGRVQPSLSSAQPPAATVGSPYDHQFVIATHLSPAPTYRVVGGSLPPGVTLTPQGQLTGTPTTPGTFEFTVAASTALSPPDCPVGATGSLPCAPGDPDSIATATRIFQIVVSGGGGTTTTSTSTTTSTTTTIPPTTTTTAPPTTTTTAPTGTCRTLQDQRAAFNAAIDARLAQGSEDPASLEQARATWNARFDQLLADANCPAQAP